MPASSKNKLPEYLTEAIERLTGSTHGKAIASAASKLFDAYRGEHLSPLGKTEKLAYLASRLPATYTVAVSLLTELQKLAPDIEFKTIADIGAGPGTFGLAALDTLTSTPSITSLERDPAWIEIGKSIHQFSPHSAKTIQWLAADITSGVVPPKADLVVAGYALNELTASNIKPAAEKIWQAAGRAVIIIEPGSRQGFDVVKKVREIFIANGAYILAPCTHNLPCPMGAPNWCHFSKIVQRSHLHKLAKSGSADYEMEKFSYIIALKGKSLGTRSCARVIAAPMLRKGHVILDVCDCDGQLKRINISRSDGEQYRMARKAKWGDVVECVHST